MYVTLPSLKQDAPVERSSYPHCSAIPTSFYITVANWCEKDAGMKLCIFTFTIISFLPCLHTFWHACHPYILLRFLSLVGIAMHMGIYILYITHLSSHWTGGLTFKKKIIFILSNETSLPCRFITMMDFIVFMNLETQFSLCRLSDSVCYSSSEALL